MIGHISRFFDLDGRISRGRFAVGAAFAILVELAAYAVMVGDVDSSPARPLYPFLAPLRGLVDRIDNPGGALDGLLFGIPIGLIMFSLWRLAALCFCRARSTGISPRIAALSIVPFVQLIVCVVLAIRTEHAPAAVDSLTAQRDRRWQAVMTGIFSAVGIAVIGTVFSTLVLGIYGFGLFAGVPLIMGFVVAYSANRDEDIGQKTYTSTAAALGLTGMALMGFAIEGTICVVFAMPIALALGFVGAFIGRAWVLRRGYQKRTMASAWLLPLLLSVEAPAPPHASFEDQTSIEIAASPLQVWDSVIHMGPIPDKPAAPFGWGVAYPQRGVIRGSGVGAVREGVFSTGVAYERVTKWEPGRQLFFDVLSDPPMMQELSQFEHVRAPHTVGYFKTLDARFTITPLGNGKTRLTLATSHELDLGPTLYFRPIAEWAIRANKQRVLRHFRDQAELSAANS